VLAEFVDLIYLMTKLFERVGDCPLVVIIP
jgi:hypothetical protein